MCLRVPLSLFYSGHTQQKTPHNTSHNKPIRPPHHPPPTTHHPPPTQNSTTPIRPPPTPTHPKQYHPERLLPALEGLPRPFLRERALLLSRLGRHEAVLRLYVERLGDAALAEAYCEEVRKEGMEGGVAWKHVCAVCCMVWWLFLLDAVVKGGGGYVRWLILWGIVCVYVG